MCRIRSWSGPTGHPARYVDGISAAVIVATVPVNAGRACAIGAGDVVVGATLVVDDVGGRVVVDDAVVVTKVVAVVELDR
jgi:hypothetical protein